MRQWLTSGLLRKILLALLAVSLAPLAILANFSLQSYSTTKDEVVQQSRQDLDQKAFEGLRARTVTLAQTVSSFLKERETDLRLLATLPRTAQAFASFAQAKQGQIWTVKDKTGDARFNMPLYRQIAFIDTTGQEVIRITNECDDYPFTCRIQVAQTLVNVGDPANTLYKNEVYFKETMALGPDEIYVGRPVGAYVPYERAYAGAQNRSGERYRGVLRFATPVFENGKRVGMVVAAMEMLHFIELTAHVAPANPEPQAEVDPREADFAYIVGPDGWAISHPRHFNIAGVDPTGQPVPSISEKDRNDPNNLYRPGNLSRMGFIDANFPELVTENQRGEAQSGKTITSRPWSGRERALGYATIPYYTGPYNTNAGFGLIVLSTDGARFHLEAQLLGKRIENRITDLSDQVRWLAGGTLLAAFILAITLAGNVAWPVLRLTRAALQIEGGNWEEAGIDQLARARGGDEVARLTRVFASMAKEVHAREAQLRQQVHELQIVIDEAKRERAVAEITESEFFQDLSERARSMREKRRRSAEASGEQEEPK